LLHESCLKVKKKEFYGLSLKYLVTLYFTVSLLQTAVLTKTFYLMSNNLLNLKQYIVICMLAMPLLFRKPK